MISGLLAPSTANFIQRPNIICKTKVAAASAGVIEEQQQRNGRSERSAALERAYVHDVYESNCDDSGTSIQPRIAQFLNNLEMGSFVCDVGCGNGRYLNACHPFIFSIGVDRCIRLTKEAHSRGGEVTVSDNLELPFRNESFDAVLSLAVIHHFATTERRINAIRELARILRIGGRVVITVWALEQKHRRFESQDVLIPTSSSMSLRNRTNSDDEDEDEFLPPYHAYTEESTNSSRSAGDGDSSSLSSSSPGESCYSFVRKTIQKLAGGRRHPWFLDSWNSRENKNDNSLDYEDAKDLPIELRRLDDFEDLPEPPLSANLKSRSLGSILNPPPQTIVRSLSSVPSLAAPDPTTLLLKNGISAECSPIKSLSNRPKLVKQKQSLCDEKSFVDIDDDDEGPRILLRKQSSLNEEYLSEGRLREKERIRKRIHKQMSLNESFLYRSVISKRLQVIREGLTTKLRTSSESMERLKNTGIARLIQNLKMSPQTQPKSNEQPNDKSDKSSQPESLANGSVGGVNGNNAQSVELDEEGKPRRRSRESGSDSSKDSSLQSDTSIESEDSSFASVIFIPRPEQQHQSSLSPGCLQTPDPTLGTSLTNSNHCYSTMAAVATNCSYSRTPTVPTSPLPCPTPAQSPAPVKTSFHTPLSLTNKAITHLDYAMTGAGGEDVKDSIRRFTFDFEIPDSTTENLLNKNSSHIFEQSLQPVQKQDMPAQTSNQVLAKMKFEIPPIPKFSGSSSSSSGSSSTTTLKKMASFPILRRSAATPVVPKLVSLEIYNPETDDSDSSEPSSPDSIDSVINALDGFKNKEVSSSEDKELEEPTVVPPERMETKDQPSLEEFAKQLNAQLLKELNESKLWEELETEPRLDQSQETNDLELTNAEKKERNSLRDELRNRRLEMANLNHTGGGGSGSNLKRFNSQFSSQLNDGSDLTIHEEEDDLVEKDADAQCSAICDTTVIEGRKEQQRNVGNSCVEDDDEIPLIEGTDARAGFVGPATNYRYSESSMSLESPGGGSVTHHRYYHVFREGELDALINHHVLDLHITSSYYERSQWCIVAEKVQVWTI